MNLSNSLFLLLSIVLFLSAGQRALAQNLDTTHYYIENQVYKVTPQDTLTIDIYYPETYGGEQLPAVVFFFGGGWTGGNRQHFSPYSKYLASRGMIAITADYRIYRKHGTRPQEAVMDARSAMRYIKQHAKEIGIDTTRLAAGGGSAGGHLAMATASLKGVDDPDDLRDVSPMPDALLLYNPVVNTTSEGYGASKVGADTLRLSPYHHILSDTPPVLIFHGEDDSTVPLSNIRDLEAKLEALLVPHVIHTYPGQGHGFFNLNREDGVYFRKTLYQTDLFLQNLGYLDGPPSFRP